MAPIAGAVRVTALITKEETMRCKVSALKIDCFYVLFFVLFFCLFFLIIYFVCFACLEFRYKALESVAEDDGDF